LLRPNQVVPADRLIDELWNESPPPAARNVVQTYVSHLRKSFGKDRLEGRAGGYLIRVEPEEIDVFRFSALIERARSVAADDPASAAQTYREALALWRGPPLDDVADHQPFEAEIARLEELRIAGVEEWLDLELGLGNQAELIPEIEALIRLHPLRERLWGQLMIALYRSGRQGDALAAFQKARRSLTEELGVEPGPDLHRLQEHVLRQDLALDLAGERVRGYRVLEEIGHGAFGEVFRARQPHVGREVAVKVIHRHLANDPDFIRRFEAEAQLVARLEHPHIVPLYDYWREPSGAFLVMRFLRGGSLRDALKEGALQPHRVAAVTDQVAQALVSAHRRDVVHRDVKPANILFDEDGNAYLSDFGIAKEHASAQVPLRGGTPSPFLYYLSPEEVQGQPPTARADIYSLGLVVYEMLAGRHPYAQAAPHEVADKHLREPLPPLATRGVPPAIDGVIERATAKDPDQRYADAAALAIALHAALDDGAAASVALPVQVRNPYKGLEPFLEADASDFFGREAMVARLLERLRGQSAVSRVLVVTGPSGSGKSSLVRAGLVPALRSGALAGSDRWFVAQMVPGDRPFAELGRALERVAPDEIPIEVAEEMQRGEDALRATAEWILPEDGSELLLVIDQFEELFTLVKTQDVRARFVATVVRAATDPSSRVRVVATIRADFYDRPLLYGGLAELVRVGTEVVVPLNAEELERAVAGPAERVGTRLDSALVAQLITDVAGQPGSLPLLQFALTELFEVREGSVVSLEAYRAIGGVHGALARRAEDTFRGLSDPAKEASRHMFLRLVAIGKGGHDTRRRVLRSDLTSLHEDSRPMEVALDAFGRARLLSFDRDPDTRAPTVEVAHEALLREWQRFREWIEGAREDVAVQRRLAGAMHDWRDAARDPSFLMSGARLEQFEGIVHGSTLGLTLDEREFIEASVSERERQRAEDDARVTRERSLERRSLQRLRGLVAVLTVAALVAAGLTFAAARERQRAEREARIATARALAAAAVSNLDIDSERSILLALEAVDATREVDDAVLPEAEEALHRAVVGSRIVRRVPGLGGGLDWSPRGHMFATEGPEGSGLIDIRDPRSGQSLRSFRGHDADVNLVAFSADGSMLATTGDDGTVRVWNPRSGDELRRFGGSGPEAEVWGPSFSPDGRLLAATWPAEGVVRVWDLATGREVHELGPWQVNFVTSFSPDGRRLAISTWDSGAVVVDTRSGDKLFALEAQGSVGDVDWSPDGRWLATSSEEGAVRLWGGRTGDSRFTLVGHRGEVVAADWSPDSTRLVTGSSDGSAKVWEITEDGTRELHSIPAQDAGGGIWVAFSPDGERVMTGDQQITAVKIWDVGPTGDAEWANIPAARQDLGGVTFTADGHQVIASNGDGSMTLWDTETGEASQAFGGRGRSPREIIAIAASPDNRFIAAAGLDGQEASWAGPPAAVYHSGTGERAFKVRTGHGVQDLAWSPDGRFLAAVGVRGSARIVERSGASVTSLPHDHDVRLSGVGFSPDGRLLATAAIPLDPADAGQEAVTIWDWQAGRAVETIRTHAEALAFDPAGSRIATAGIFGSAVVWDVDRGKKVATLSGHTGPVNDVTFAPDGSTIATASADGTIRVWDARSGIQRLSLRGHETAVWDLAFSADGSKLASSSPDGIVRVWALDIDDLIQIARQEVTRSLTEAECRVYLHQRECPWTPASTGA